MTSPILILPYSCRQRNGSFGHFDLSISFFWPSNLPFLVPYSNKITGPIPGGRSIPKKDNTTSYKGRKYQVLSMETRLGFTKAKVEVQKHLGGTIHIFYKGQELPFKPIIPQEHQQYAPSQKETLTVGV